MLARAGLDGDSIATHTINFSIEFVVKHKKRIFGGCVKEVMKNVLRNLRGILIIVIQTINTDINGFVQWNVSK